jgi:chemotaxis family two-component system response regulator Rcp1
MLILAYRERRKITDEDIMQETHEEPPKEVLLVDDSPGDIRLMREALRNANPDIHLHVATDGLEALAFLNQQGAYAKSPRPELILLDLNLPGISGREVLARIKQDTSLKLIPTVVLSTSADEADIRECYKLQANCYLTKPLELDAFETLVKNISDFWIERALLPSIKFFPISRSGEERDV